jgi:general secretion pathway protein M
MDRLRKLKDSLEATFGRLTERERLIVIAGAVVVLVFTVAMVSRSVGKSVAQREANIEKKTRLLAEVGKLTQGYRAVEAERQALEAKLKGPPTQLVTFISQTSQRLGIEVNNLRAQPPAGSEKIKEDSVEVELLRIDLVKLARLLEELERGPGVIRVRRIQMRTMSDDPNLVNVTVLVATFQLQS